MRTFRATTIAGMLAMVTIAALPGEVPAREVWSGQFVNGVTHVFDSGSGSAVASIPGPTLSAPSTATGLSASLSGGFGFISFQGSDNVEATEVGGFGGKAGLVDVGPDPRAPTVTPDGSRAYVPNSGANTVSVIDIASLSVTDTILLGGGVTPSGIAFRPDGSRAFVAASTGNLYVLDTNPASGSYGTVTDTIPIAGTLNSVAVAPDPDGAGPVPNRAYVTSSSAGSVTVVDADTAGYPPITTIAGVGTTPTAIAVNPAGTRAYVANETSPGTVEVINTDSSSAQYNTVIASPATQNGTNAVSVQPGGAKVYATNRGSNSVSVIDATTNAVLTTVPVPATLEPLGIVVYFEAFASKDYAAVVGAGSTQISIIDTVFDTVAETRNYTALPPRNYTVAITPDGRRAYVNLYQQARVQVIDTDTKTQVATIGVGLAPAATAVSPDGSRVYVGNFGSSSVSVVDTSTNTVVATVAGVKPNLGGVAVRPDGEEVWALDFANDRIAIIDAATNTISSTVSGIGLSAPMGIAFAPDGGKAYITNLGSGAVKVVDGTTHALVTTIPNPAGTWGIAVNASGTYAYAAYASPPLGIYTISTSSDSVVSTTPSVGAEVPIVPALLPNGSQGFYATLNSGTYGFTPGGSGTGQIADLAVGLAARPNQSPTAQLSAGNGGAGQPITFDASGSSDDGPASGLEFTWQFDDGATLTGAGSVVQHAFATPGEHTVSVTVDDTEGCPGFAFTGQTASCNGPSTSTASTTVSISTGPGTGTGEPCTVMSDSPLPAQQRDRTRVRIRLEYSLTPGGVFLSSYQRAKFEVVATKVGRLGKRGKSIGLRKVGFELDGKPAQTVTQAPFAISLSPNTLSSGRHMLRATAYPQRGKALRRTIRFERVDCDAAAFLARITQKHPGRYTNIEVQAHSGGAVLDSAKFYLPENLIVGTPRTIADSRIGTIAITRADGSTITKPLRYGRLKNGELDLASYENLDVRLADNGKQRILKVESLVGRGVNAVDVFLLGKRFQRLLKLPRRCQSFEFKAVLAGGDGETQSLKRTVLPKRCR